MPEQSKPKSRHAEPQVLGALSDTRIVALVGPRQSGKTTLARKIASKERMNFITLDDEQSRQFANDDPGGFMRGLERAVIDEVQRAPGLILVLKKTVDEDPRPGRFLITGSVDLFKGTISPDSLAGRVETIKLLPFSQSEIVRRKPPGFFEKAFGVDFPTLKETGRTTDLIKRVIAGGYPEALMRQDERRRQTWLRSYASALTTRDVAEILPVFKTDELSRLLNHAAVSSGELVNLSALAAPLGVDSKKINRWMNLLEQMFIL
ncbi:MAG: ATP-binding protein [Hyphomonadaceae bacterium]|nr:ATP-binding protein [Hyphomonadaceae bacterium]